MKKRIVLALVVSLVIFGAFYASAASLGVDGGVVQAGVDVDLVCDDNGVTIGNWVYESVGQKVYSVRIDGIDGACAGQELIVGLHNAAGGDLGSYTTHVPSGGGSVSVSFPGGEPVEPIYQVSVALVTSP